MLRNFAFGLMAASLAFALLAAIGLSGCAVPGGTMLDIGTVTVTQSPATTTTQTSTASSGRPWPAPEVSRDREPGDRGS